MPLAGEVWTLNQKGEIRMKVKVPGTTGDPVRITGLAFVPTERKILATSLDGRLHWFKLRPGGGR